MVYAIGSYTIDVARREVRRLDALVPAEGVPDAAVAVEPKVFDLLLYLVVNRCRAVSKDELVERIWQGRAISDAALSSCVKAARRAIGDDGRQQRQIRTLHRHGFRFIGSVVSKDVITKDVVIKDLDPSVARSPAVPPDGGSNAGESASPTDAAACDLDLSLPVLPSIAILPIQALGNDGQSGLLAAGFD